MDYKNGKIYCLRSYKTDNIYIGSTTQPLRKRLYEHKQDYKRWINGKYNYISSFEIIKEEDCYIELIEYADCKTKAELRKKEGEFIRKMECVNKRIAGRTPKEYIKDNEEKMKKWIKEYYKKYNKEYRKTEKYKNYQREYEKSKKCKEYRKKYMKEYYQKKKWKKRFNEVLKEIK